MSDDGRDPFAIPKDMRAMAEASFDQARKAFDKFMESAQTTAGTIEERRDTVRAGAKEIGSKAVSYAEKNVQASLDYAQSLLKAKDLPEVMKLHATMCSPRCARFRSRRAKWDRSSAAPRWMRPSRKAEIFQWFGGTLGRNQCPAPD